MAEITEIRPLQEADNVLKLETPENYAGQLWKYQAGHSVLMLRVSKTDALESSPIYVGFEMVWYIDLSVSWQGGNIKTAPEQECLALLSELNFFGENLEVSSMDFQNYASAGMRLFLIDTPKKQYKILANSSIALSTEPYI